MTLRLLCDAASPFVDDGSAVATAPIALRNTAKSAEDAEEMLNSVLAAFSLRGEMIR